MGRNKKQARKRLSASGGKKPAGTSTSTAESTTSAGASRSAAASTSAAAGASATASTSSAGASANRSTKNGSKFVVGLDFGTTYTSVAFAYSETPDNVQPPDNIKLVQKWPRGSADQVPTRIEYMKPDIRWGYEVSDFNDANSKPLKWFKLLLQEPDAPSSAPNEGVGQRNGLGRVTELPEEEPTSPWVTPKLETAKFLHELNVTPVKVVADFLQKIRETTMECIKTTYPMQAEVESKVEWILTVPAIWKDAAKDMMIRAARQAGFGERGVGFELTSEPECGATHALNVLQEHNLSPGDVFVICDAGGGTVDLISYKITEIQPLRVDEVVPGSGDLCGSVFLDKRFIDYMQRTLGDTFTDMQPEQKNGVMKDWEQIKCQFGNGTPSESYSVVVPGQNNDEKLKVQNGYHAVKHEDVQKIFDPVVRRIISLVSEQVSKVEENGEDVNAILLVGGFGSSEYLRKRLSEHTYGNREFKVLQPVHARTAIARGALIRGIGGSMIVTRRARRYYGSTADDLFTPGGNYPPGVKDHMYMDPRFLQLLIEDKMTWHVKKGATIEPSRTTFLWSTLLPPDRQPDFIFSSTLYACELNEAPEYKWQNPPEVKPVCKLVANLARIPKHNFRLLMSPIGLVYLMIECQYQMALVNETWVFELLFKGERYGVVETRYT